MGVQVCSVCDRNEPILVILYEIHRGEQLGVFVHANQNLPVKEVIVSQASFRGSDDHSTV